MIDHTLALELALEYSDVPADQVVAGAPRVGIAELGTIGGSDYGVWEMTPGAVSDVEVDELFIVIAGHAVVELEHGGSRIELSPGSLGRLAAGTRTVWTVTETLRKIYIA
jgi:uncharacterized cupin superfamily protein